LGNQIPTFGVNSSYFAELFKENSSFGFLNALTGNSLSQLSVLALSITPYITASIIVQLLTIAIPRLEEIAKGMDGHEKIEKMTYIVAGILGYLEAGAMAVGFGKQGLLTSYTWYNCLLVTIIWGTGALVTVLFGKIIDKKGIGNGISLILLMNILSSIPADIITLYERFCSGKPIMLAILCACVIIFIALVVFVFALILNKGEKRISIQYSGKIMGNRRTVGQSSFIPVKVCIAGVMPVIFASSFLSFPIIICRLLGKNPKIINYLNSGNWFVLSRPVYTAGYLFYVLLVIFFGYFYTSISFNSYEVAENLKKNGGTICGIRPGKPTVEYLDRQMKYLIFIGTTGILILATIPMLISGIFGIGSLSFGGTSIMIIASVILEMKKTLETECMYKSFHLF